MNSNNILYQIKSLEKSIMKYFIKKDGLNKENLSFEIASEPAITPTQMQILEYILKNSDKEIYQKDLEEILNLTRATVSGVLQTMERNGLIERIISVEDTRTKKIILTSKTKDVFLNGQKKMQEIENFIIKDISNEDLEIFSKVIKVMKNNVSKLQGREENIKHD